MKRLTDFDRELIKRELDDHYIKDFKFEYINPTNKWIDWLFNNYYLHEMVENFYDHEEYCEGYSEDESSEEQERNRKQFCNWQEVIGEGIWGMSQKRCNDIARENLKRIQKNGKNKDRFYVQKTNKAIFIFFYGRDFSTDYWMIFAKNGVDLWTENF